jgi:hypothetical protein
MINIVKVEAASSSVSAGYSRYTIEFLAENAEGAEEELRADSGELPERSTIGCLLKTDDCQMGLSRKARKARKKKRRAMSGELPERSTIGCLLQADDCQMGCSRKARKARKRSDEL